MAPRFAGRHWEYTVGEGSVELPARDSEAEENLRASPSWKSPGAAPEEYRLDDMCDELRPE